MFEFESVNVASLTVVCGEFFRIGDRIFGDWKGQHEKACLSIYEGL